MKKTVILLLALSLVSFASNFSDGIRAYKAGHYNIAKNMFEHAIEDDGAQQAQFLLGLLYLNGEGVKKDLVKAQQLFSKAIVIGNVRAKCYLAKVYLLRKNKSKKTVINLLKAGRNGGADECVQIAKAYNIPL